MSIWSRIMLLLRVKTRAALERAEDPREVMTYVDEQQQELLRKVKQGLIEVAISKRQLQQQVEKLRVRVPQVEAQARRAVAAGRDDLARLALERKQTALAELEDLEVQVENVEGEERRLVVAEQQLAGRIEEFRTRRQMMAARYSAAEAQVRINEALSGVSQDFADIGTALGRAEEKIDRMLARASALDALIDLGVLAPAGSGQGDVVERQLRQMEVGEAVDEELATLRAELVPGQSFGAGSRTRQIGPAAENGRGQ
ncbi:MAG: PspA/IM30 family protein [Chloroflexi bacterium]|nr:PspA/IM30 family protein [Chloroflexota bacterium]